MNNLYQMKKLSSICILLLCAVIGAHAQADLQNTGVFYISTASDIVYVSNSLTNASGAALTNNGSLYVGQTLSNAQASMATGTGTLYLNGTSSQSVAGTQVFKTFNLVTDNVGGIVLNNNLDVNGAHTFTNGIISSSATPNYLIYESSATYSGDGDAAHVSGWVSKVGSSDFTFPVGNGVVERPVTISSLTASSQFNAHHYQSTPNTGNLLAPLVSVNPNEYWIINRVSGGNANVNMNWDNSKIAFPQYPLASIRAGYYNAGLWTNYGGSATGNTTTTGNITSNQMTSFGTFAIASISASLPLDFLSTYAYRQNAGTLIEWRTANEVNVDHFEVERSVDGRVFVKVGTVASTKNPSIGDYSFTDNFSKQGKVYYRIRSVDRDGKYMFSKVVSVTDGQQDNELFTVVNPVVSRIYLNVTTLPAGNYDYQLRTEAGQSVQSGVLHINGSGTYSIILTGAVRPGIYLLTVSDLNMVRNEKLRIL